MAVKIQIKRGTKAGLPTLAPGEYGLATDTNELFVGTASGNVQIPVLGSDGKIPGGQLPSMDYLPTAGGTMTGAIAMGGNKIAGLAAPTAAADAARKQDVDDFEPQSSAVQLSAAAQAALGLGSGSTLDDAMELLAKGETLFETTINQSGQQINVAIDPSTWSEYTYVIVDLGLPVPAATGIYYIRMNNSASTNQGCNYLVNNFNDNWSHDDTFIGYLWKRLVGTLNARLIFYVGKDNTNDITVFTVCGESYCVGHFQNQRYVTSASINIVGASSSTIGAGATVRIWGVK